MPRRRKKRAREQDRLEVQVAIKAKLPPGKKLSRDAMDEILERVVNGAELPRNVEVRGIFWRNPNRRGRLADWRYSEGADLSMLKPGGAGVESSPRGSLSEAIESLHLTEVSLRSSR